MAKREYTVVLPPRKARRHITFLIPKVEEEVGRSACGKKTAGWTIEGVQELFNKDCIRCMRAAVARKR